MLTSVTIDAKRHLSGWKVKKIDLTVDKDESSQGKTDNDEATRQNKNMQGSRRGERVAENTLTGLELEVNTIDSLVGMVKFGDSPSSTRSMDIKEMASSLTDSGNFKYIKPKTEEKEDENRRTPDGLDTGPRTGKIDRPTPEPKKPRKTKEKPSSEQRDCGSCDVAIKGDMSAIKCEDCSFLRKKTEANTLEVYFLKNQVEPWQGINIPRRVLHEAGTTAVLSSAEAKELIQAGMARLAMEET